MKPIRINLHPVEEAMLVAVQKSNKHYRDVESLLLEYAKTLKGRAERVA